MEVNLSNVAARLLLGKTADSVTLNNPVKAEVVESREDGTVVLNVAGEKVTLNLKDLQAQVGDELNLVFTRGSDGNLKVQVMQLPGFSGTPAAVADTDAISLSSLTRLYYELSRAFNKGDSAGSEAVKEFKAVFEQLLTNSARNLDLSRALGDLAFPEAPQQDLLSPSPDETLPLPSMPAPLFPGSQLPAGEAAAVPSEPVPAGAQVPAPAPVVSGAPSSAPKPPVQPVLPVALLQRLIYLADEILKSKDTPQAVKQKIAEIIPAVRQSFLQQASAARQGITLIPPDKISDPLKLPLNTPFALKVESVRPSGMAVVSTAGGARFEMASPVSVKRGDFLPAAYSQAKGLTLSPGPAAGASDAILETVKSVAREMNMLSGKQAAMPASALPAPLQAIAVQVQSVTDKYRLTPEESTSLIRSLLMLHSKGVAPDAVTPELSLFQNVRTFGAGVDEILRQALSAEKSGGKKGWADELLKILQPLMEKPLLDNDAASRVAALKRIFENNGQFFENKLFKLLEESALPQGKTHEETKAALKAALQNDLKSVLQQVLSFMEKSDPPAPLRERIQQEAVRLGHIIDAVQVKNLAEDNYHHLFIPLVNAGEERSALVTIQRRGKKKKVDGKNTSLTVRVSPSVLGDVEGRVEIKNGTVWVHFFLESDPFVTLFLENQAELWDGIKKTGYSRGSFKASLFPRILSAGAVTDKGKKGKKGPGAGLDVKA